MDVLRSCFVVCLSGLALASAGCGGSSSFGPPGPPEGCSQEFDDPAPGRTTWEDPSVDDPRPPGTVPSQTDTFRLWVDLERDAAGSMTVFLTANFWTDQFENPGYESCCSRCEVSCAADPEAFTCRLTDVDGDLRELSARLESGRLVGTIDVEGMPADFVATRP